MKKFQVEPGRAVLFSFIFSVIVILQGSVSWGWWLPLIVGSAGLFYAGNVFYVWANNKIRHLVQGER
ncbi:MULTISPECIES: hypothetical protein [unclassified Corynebacterium]|uniref:hypothetical protein n=1 Tax=unclassified Corynebacterium TaxID=2624378 RepID=UPI0029CA174C|nr:MULTISPECIES: hypothetical protein [unclassified Corynebacterium]WPF66563.1 hypothetical protein OLX12_02200 [Corynebacterium sp. 22KM0430]WPF69052.1 hypothetical protein OLW90_02195 [Corynebacterium sp. 21KM1197]